MNKDVTRHPCLPERTLSLEPSSRAKGCIERSGEGSSGYEAPTGRRSPQNVLRYFHGIPRSAQSFTQSTLWMTFQLKEVRGRKHYLIVLTIILCVFESLSLKAQSLEGVSITRDIVYGRVQDVELKLDMAKPPEGNATYPALIFFHGGGWQQGDKSHMHRWLKKFASAGYVTVSVGYRFAPAFKWPSQVEDAKTAVRFLRAHARQFNIDPNRIGVMGESAGGYLALMLGFTDPTDGLDGEGDYQSFSSSVQAVVSFYSATDFSGRTWQLTPALEAEIQRYYNKSLPQVIADFTGTNDTQDPILKKISVLPYVDKNDPPVLMFHGDSDPYSPVERAQKFEQVLTQANILHQLIIVKGGGHGWTGALQEETTRQMAEFFDKILKEKRQK